MFSRKSIHMCMVLAGLALTYISYTSLSFVYEQVALEQSRAPALCTLPDPSDTVSHLKQSRIFFLHDYGAVEHFELLCSIESAARIAAEMGKTVTVMATNWRIVEYWLSYLPSTFEVEVCPLKMDMLMAGTPLYSWFNELPSASAFTPFTKQHLSDALRLALLYHYSGTYLDLDLIPLNPGLLDEDSIEDAELVPIAGKCRVLAKCATHITNAFMHFRDLRDGLVLQLMNTFVSTYNSSIWSIGGSRLLGRFFTKCDHKDKICHDTYILPAHAVCVLPPAPSLTLLDELVNSSIIRNWHLFLSDQSQNRGIFGLHFYQAYRKYYCGSTAQDICVVRGSLLDSVMHDRCPDVRTKLASTWIWCRGKNRFSGPGKSCSQHLAEVKNSHLAKTGK